MFQPSTDSRPSAPSLEPVPGNLRDYHRYQRFPIYPRRPGGAGRRRYRPRPSPPQGKMTWLGRWIVRVLGGRAGPGGPAGGRSAGSMDR